MLDLRTMLKKCGVKHWATLGKMLCDVKHCDENCGDIGQSQENLLGGVLRS